MFTNREDKCGKRKSISSSRYKHFIAELPEATRNIIRKDLEEHAREHHYRLEWDRESKDYVAMSRRFCDMENIYTDTYLHFCETGEDIDPYEKA